MFWGASPALDLYGEYLQHHEPLEEVNILVVGGLDTRHVIKTLSRLRKHRNNGKRTKVNLYLMEACLESVGRQLLLLSIALETEEKLRLERKTRFFMEIYGNTLVRPAVSNFLTKRSEFLVDLVTRDLNENSLGNMKIVNLENLQYKERDYLENLLKFWASRNAKNFDIQSLWDKRVRRALGVRYDSKFGAFDWDLHMKLHQVGADQITIYEYKEFRNTGVGFTWNQNEVSKPNRSLVAGVVPAGDCKFLHRGYLGDITVGPHVAYGLECENKELTKKRNGINENRATDITEYNLKEIFSGIFGKGYEEKLEEVAENEGIDNFSIRFLSCSASLDPYSGIFDAVWFSNFLVGRISPQIVRVLKPKSVLILEGIRFDPGNRKEQYDDFQEKVKQIGSFLPEKCATEFDPTKHSFAKFVLKEFH